MSEASAPSPNALPRRKPSRSPVVSPAQHHYAVMTRNQITEPRNRGEGTPRLRRGELPMRIAECIFYVLLGIVLFLAWHHFKDTGGISVAHEPQPPDPSLERGITAAIFLAGTPLVPLAGYLLLCRSARRSARPKAQKGRH